MTLRTTVFSITGAAAAALFAIGSMAQAATFGELDTDGDGVLSPEEFVMAYPGASEAVFIAIDADGSGMVDEAEHSAAVDAGLLNQDG